MNKETMQILDNQMKIMGTLKDMTEDSYWTTELELNIEETFKLITPQESSTEQKISACLEGGQKE